MINFVPMALNISLSVLAFEDSINTYYYVYKRNPSSKNATLFLSRHISAFGSAFNCMGNTLELCVSSSRVTELICKVYETGLNIFRLMGKWDGEKAIRIFSDALCATRVFWEMFKSSEPQKIFYYDLCWQFLAILELASRLLIVSTRKS
ncbi:MAG: hypothetical protein H0W50_06215 [Parachlamydiaceae bacterium]|nr:hypothetical protein [Parachlamydiaceae bacterium]